MDRKLRVSGWQGISERGGEGRGGEVWCLCNIIKI